MAWSSSAKTARKRSPGEQNTECGLGGGSPSSDWEARAKRVRKPGGKEAAVPLSGPSFPWQLKHDTRLLGPRLHVNHILNLLSVWSTLCRSSHS